MLYPILMSYHYLHSHNRVQQKVPPDIPHMKVDHLWTIDMTGHQHLQITVSIVLSVSIATV